MRAVAYFAVGFVFASLIARSVSFRRAAKGRKDVSDVLGMLFLCWIAWPIMAPVVWFVWLLDEPEKRP